MADIERILQAAAGRVWLIDEDKGLEIAQLLALRADGAAPGAAEAPEPIYAAEPIKGRTGPVHVLRLEGTIVPRSGMMSRFSGGASLERFGEAFDQAAADRNAQAIVIQIDSPGGVIDLVAETAEKIYRARRDDRPIVAVANTMAASAAYWIASSASEIVVTPSGSVGSIGVYGMHDDMSAALEARGIRRTLIRAGARKAEGAVGPLDEPALKHRQASVDEAYDQFTRAVARNRGVDVARVRADPEEAEQHFGGGRAYPARQAVRLGMADRVATLEATLRRLARGQRSPAVARRRIGLA